MAQDMKYSSYMGQHGELHGILSGVGDDLRNGE